MKAIGNDIFAKVLSAEDISIVRVPGDSASFDIKSRTLRLPIFQKDLPESVEEMFISHEVGHALWTDEGYVGAIRGSKNPRVFKGYLNILEDVRIEKLMKQRYPGLRKTFNAGYKDVVENDLFSITKQAKDNPGRFSFIDRINLYFKFGQSIEIPFSEKEREYLPRIFAMNTVTDVVNMANEIIALEESESDTDNHESYDPEGELQESDERGEGSSQAQESEDGEENEDGQSSSGSEGESEEDGDSEDGETGESEDGEDTGSDTDSGDADGESEDGEDTDGDSDSGDADGEDADGDEENPGGESDGSSSEDGDSENSENTAPEPETDQSFNEEFKRLSGNYSDVDNLFVGEDYGLDSTIVSYKDFYSKVKKNYGSDIEREYSKLGSESFEKETKKMVDMLSQEFEMKKAAERLSRAQTSKTGALDVKKLYAYKTKKELFKQVTVVPDGKNHGMIMLLDWSGSMSYILSDAVKQVIALVEFCRRVGIPYRVYATRCNDNGIDRRGLEITEGAMYSGNSTLLELFSNEMTSRELRFAKMAFSCTKSVRYVTLTYPLSATPIASGVLKITNGIMDKFIRRYNIEKPSFVVVTDGEDNQGFSSSRNFNGQHYVGTYSYCSETNTIINDNKSKYQYNINDMYKAPAIANYKVLDLACQIMKDRFGGMPIAVFHIAETTGMGRRGSGNKVVNSYYNIRGFERVPEDYRKKVASELRKHNCAILETSGCFDGLFMIKMKNGDTETEFEVNKNNKKVTAKALSKALSSNIASKKENRVLLSKFVDTFV